MPAISVIAPVYNVEQYLARCLDSILSQTFTDFEVICVNDGTQDSSGVILQEYAQKDARITIINQENQGLSMARNNGMKAAQGEYILFVDSDDAIEKQLLEIAYGAMVTYQADMVCWDYSISDGQALPEASFDNDTIEIAITNNLFIEPYRVPHSVWSKMFRKKFIDFRSFIPNIFFEDAPYTWEIILDLPTTAIIAAPLYLYTSNPNSITKTNLTLKHIKDYHAIAVIIYNLALHRCSGDEDITRWMQHVIKGFIVHQFKFIQQLPIHNQLPLWIAFEVQLQDLKAKGVLNAYRKNEKVSRFSRLLLQCGAKAYYEREIVYWYKKLLHCKDVGIVKTYYIRGIKIFSKEKLDVQRRRLSICGITINYTSRT